ncbi:hypothetical protein K466DRAFT_18697 [Polyporus arcularius HHB13444]|uniref:Uncharacterized protein n=1 Tax=Polyporus arcularius HHB13444 TaxID=1314778 RepID=A0A5C3NP64_9APHY|nr:hypothetical protein K466DRAFT_18697 [Polyporus arcularius HHB13444]
MRVLSAQMSGASGSTLAGERPRRRDSRAGERERPAERQRMLVGSLDGEIARTRSSPGWHHLKEPVPDGWIPWHRACGGRSRGRRATWYECDERGGRIPCVCAYQLAPPASEAAIAGPTLKTDGISTGQGGTRPVLLVRLTFVVSPSTRLPRLLERTVDGEPAFSRLRDSPLTQLHATALEVALNNGCVQLIRVRSRATNSSWRSSAGGTRVARRFWHGELAPVSCRSAHRQDHDSQPLPTAVALSPLRCNARACRRVPDDRLE